MISVLEPEVTATPAPGQQVGHRVAVLLPAQAQAAWPGDAQRLRAIAEPRLNAWAAAILGPPEAIRFTAAFATQDAAAGVQRSYSLADFDLCPLDVVSLAAPRVESAPLLTLLRLMLRAKGPDGREFTGEVSIDAHAGAAPLAGTRSLTEAVGLAYAVARMLRASRALTPADLLVDMAGSGDAESMASTLADLSTRAAALRTAFGNLQDAFIAAPSQPDVWWRAALLVGPVDPAGSDATQTILAGLAQRQAAYDAATQQHGAAAVHMGMALAQLTAIVGRDCTILPVFKAANAGELAACVADQATLLEGDLTRPQRWLQDYARVRASVETLDLALTLSELYAGPTALTVGQLPLMPGQVWIGEHLPAHGSAPRLSLVAHTPFPVAFSQDLAGLLVDAWSEVVPTATATTGLAFHYDEPRAQAPQALLLAVPPDLSRGWTFEDLEATVRETLDMARIRAVPAQRALYVTTWGGYLPALTLTHNLRQDLVQA